MTDNPIEQAIEALERIQGLRNESKGVYGFHLNGDLEDWDYFEIDYELDVIRQTLQARSVDVEKLKENTWSAIQHPHNGNLEGIKEKEKACHQTIDHLHAQGYLGQKWQPIETAPRDGTSMLLLCEGVTHYGRWLRTPRVMNPKKGFFDWEGWQVELLNGKQALSFDPTHWMPLPPPPTQESGE